MPTAWRQLLRHCGLQTSHLWTCPRPLALSLWSTPRHARHEVYCCFAAAGTGITKSSHISVPCASPDPTSLRYKPFIREIACSGSIIKWRFGNVSGSVSSLGILGGWLMFPDFCPFIFSIVELVLCLPNIAFCFTYPYFLCVCKSIAVLLMAG